jgi:hypothetical protein
MSDMAVTSASTAQTTLGRWAVERRRLDQTINRDPTAATGASSDQGLRKRLGEFVGNIFYGTLIKQMQESKLKGKYFHGGRGEEVFQGQLGMELAGRLGKAANNAVVNSLCASVSRQDQALAKVAGKSLHA